MLNKLSRKDIELLNILAQTPEGKSALEEYIKQHEKAVKAYKIYRESVVAEVEVEKVVKPVETKRKFKVGDKVRVLNTENALDTAGLEIGDVAEVIEYTDLIGGGVVELKTPKRTKRACFIESALELVKEKTPNELRAEIIQRAKEFVEEKDGYGLIWLKLDGKPRCVVDINFVVNDKKRTVAALLKGFLTREVNSKGIAKCNPDDVFNADIGKAIALGRALDEDVSEFENAVQPNEPVVGHVVKGNEVLGPYRQDRKFALTSKKDCDSFYYAENNWGDFIYSTQIGAIIDDTNAIYKEVE